MPEAPPKKINPSKFMGASFAAGSKLEEKVENNSKKITLLKNIISLRKKNIDEKIESLKPEETDNNTELMNGLHSVIESLVGVKKVLLDKVKGRIVERKNLRLQNERQSKKRREDLDEHLKNEQDFVVETSKLTTNLLPHPIHSACVELPVDSAIGIAESLKSEESRGNANG